MDRARRAGWWFKPSGSSGHIFGTLTCTQLSGDRRLGDGNCAHRVYSTAGDSAETAKIIDGWLRTCPHGTEDRGEHQASLPAKDQGRIDKAQSYMDVAEKLLDAADRLASGERSRERADELLEEAARATDAAQRELFDEAVVVDGSASAAAGDARELAADTGLDHEPWPPPEGSGERLVSPAGEYLDEASGLLQGSHGQEAQSAGERLSSLQDRLGGWLRAP